MIVVPGLKIEGPLGKGGTAAVAKAFSDEFRKYVALKYPLTDNSESSAQFNKLASRESQLIGKIKFPGIVNIFTQSQNPPFLLLELCGGQSLEKIGRVEAPDMLLQVLCSLAADLEFLRINKIVHCDIKPHNFFLPADFPLYEKGKLFFTKLSDFSLGRHFYEPESARAGHGTVGYTAPETLKNGKTSHQSDLFALGVTAYQLATGKHPFAENETDPVKIESRTQESEPDPLGKMRSDLPEKFIHLVNHLLAKNEDSRPESAWRVCESLRACGCDYPFEKVISPHFLSKSQLTYNEFADSYLELTPNETEQLRNLTASKPDYLRMLLTSNYRKGILAYNGDKFEFRTSIYWPSILRRRTFAFFSKSSFSQKKGIVKAAISGTTLTLSEHSTGTKIIFPFLLSVNTIKRHSAKIAEEFEQNGDWHKSAKLFLQAGLLEQAIVAAKKAVIELKDSTGRSEAVNLINRVCEYARFVDREFDVRQLLMSKGDIQRAGGDIDSSMSTYNKIISLYAGKPSDKLLAETYRDLGDLYKSKQQFQLGIEVLYKALEIYKALKDELEMSRALNNIGELYRIATDLPNSLKYMRQALVIQKRLKEISAVANSLNNMAITYGTAGRLKRAIIILNISLKMKKILGDEGEIARTLNNLGYAYHLTGNQSESALVLAESLTINRKIGSKKEVLFNLWNLSEVTFKSGNLRLCLQYLQEGLELSNALDDKPHMSRFHLSLGNALLKLGRYSESAVQFSHASKLGDEIDDELLKITLDICKAELRRQIGDLPGAKSLAESALNNSEKLKIKTEVLRALSVLVGLTGSGKYLKSARALISEEQYEKNRLIVEFNYFHFLIDSGFIQDADRLIGPFVPQLLNQQIDIEIPRLLNIAGEYLINRKDLNEAINILKKSLSSAKSFGLLADEMNACILLGKAAVGAGGYEQAFDKYKIALQLCKKIVANINNDGDKKLFMNKPNVKLLVTEINRLGEKLSAKKKAGV